MVRPMGRLIGFSRSMTDPGSSRRPFPTEENPMSRSIGRTILVAALYSSTFYGQSAPSPQPPTPQLSNEIVVAASKLPEDPLDVPADTTVIQGKDLRARGAQTLGDALATAAGVAALDGTDARANLPNV